MSDIQNVIDRIAIYAEQNNLESCLSGWMRHWFSIMQLRKHNKFVAELNSDVIKEILSYFSRDVEPQLSFEKIAEITKDYPFQLPLEIYELYSRGNGCLPIGLNNANGDNKKSYAHYFYFPGGDEIGFKPLHECMDFYKALAEWKEEYQTNFDLHWFPVAFFEDLIIAVIGNEEQQKTSPIIYFYSGDLELRVNVKYKIAWSSVTNMLSAWIKVREQGLHNSIKENESQIEAICKKYGAKYPKCAFYVP